MTEPTTLADLRVVAEWQRTILHDGYRPATRRDLLQALGWVECETCSGWAELPKVLHKNRECICHFDRKHCKAHTDWYACLDCIEGLIPSTKMVEADAEAQWDGVEHPWSEDTEEIDLLRDWYRTKVRRGLLAAFKEDR